MPNNVAAALCYLLTFVTGILFLALEPYNKDPTVRFHAFQAIFMGVGIFIVNVVLGFLFSIIHLSALFFLFQLTGFAFFLLWLYMMFSAYQGNKVILPVIGALAQRQQ